MSSDHWHQFYHQSPSPTIFSVAGDGVSDATTVTTCTVSNSVTAPAIPATASVSTGHLSGPEGRVAKPVRRRSRASRRTPTTLLNTDTTNFRAMVQQFTGGPCAPFGTTSSQGFSFAMNCNPREGQVGPGGVMISPNSGFHIQYQNPQQNQLPYLFSLGNNGGANSTGQGDTLFNRIGNNNKVSAMADDGCPLGRAPPSSSSNENRGNSFLF